MEIRIIVVVMSNPRNFTFSNLTGETKSIYIIFICHHFSNLVIKCWYATFEQNNQIHVNTELTMF